jgi:hypothetical protein
MADYRVALGWVEPRRSLAAKIATKAKSAPPSAWWCSSENRLSRHVRHMVDFEDR